MTRPIKSGRQRRRRRRRAILAGIILLPVVYLSFVGMLARHANPHEYPETAEELSTYYAQVPPEENAAPLYEKAFALSPSDANLGKVMNERARNNQPLRIEDWQTPFPDDVLAALAKDLETNCEYFELLHQASALKKCRFALDFARGDSYHRSTGIPFWEPDKPLNWEAISQADWQLCLKARFEVGAGHTDMLPVTLLAAAALPRALANVPNLDTQMKRAGFVFGCTHLLEYVLSNISLPDDALGSIQAAMAELECPDAIAHGLIGARCTGLACFDDPYPTSGTELVGMFTHSLIEELSPVDSNTVINKGYHWSGFRNMDRSAFLNTMDYALSVGKMPYPDMLAVKDFHKFVSWRTPVCRMFIPAKKEPIITSGTHHRLAPCLQEYFCRQAGAVARVRLACTAIAIERYRLANHSLPATLSDLVPDWLRGIPVDPYDGLPLRYKDTGKGYILYSVGENRLDDEGSKDTDNIFAVERL